MNRKKAVLIFGGIFASFAILALCCQLVSAVSVSDVIERGPQQLVDMIKSFTTPIFEAILNTSAYDEYFFSRVLLLLLLFFVLYALLGKMELFEDRTGIKFIVASAVSIIGMRYLTMSDFINGILLPYGVLAVAITVGLTFLIFGYFVHESVHSGNVRKLMWILYLAIFLGMWLDRFKDLSSGVNTTYSIGTLLIIAAIAFDRHIQEYIGLKESQDAERGILTQKLAFIEAKLNTLYGVVPRTPHIDAAIRDLEREQTRTIRKLSRL